MSKIHFISALEFSAIVANSPECCKIDVRTSAEHAACHVTGVDLYPLQNIDPDAMAQEIDQKANGKPVYILCKAGGRAKQAAEKLNGKTASDIYVVEGGTDACVELGSIPVYIGDSQAVMSLERQVRIAAGALVVLGVVLRYIVAPQFVWLSAFVGAGLMFAGLTDTCAMGMLIARMPWNKA